MRLLLVVAFGCLMIFPGNALGGEYPGHGGYSGFPITFYEGCSQDFDGNGFWDNAMLIEASKVELVVIMRNMNGSRLFTLYENNEPAAELLRIACRNVLFSADDPANAIVYDEGVRKIEQHEFEGHVIFMLQPGRSTWFYYWKKDKFIKVLLRD